MKTYKTNYTNNEHSLIWVDLDLTPFLDDGLNEYQAIEQACEVFERNCDNFKCW